MNIDKFYMDSIEKIYSELYIRINKESINIFLCGGVSTDKQCIRDSVRKIMEKYKNIRILYPEDMFMDILSKDKSIDLLSLENFLADNSDVICILPESAGSLVELGAFTNNEKTLEKLFVIMREKYRKQKSFIMTGPIKYISKQKGKDRIIFYEDDNLESVIKKAINTFKKFNNTSRNSKIEINTIIGQYYFIPLLLYFLNNVLLKDIKEIFKRIYSKHNISDRNIDMILGSSIKLLYKNKLISKNVIDQKISLTSKGKIYIKNILNKLSINKGNKLYDYIRYGIMISELVGNAPLENTM